MKAKTITFYTNAEIQEMKELIRTGKPILQIADELHAKWGRPISGITGKLYQVAKRTKKIAEWNGPKRRTGVQRPKSSVQEGVTLPSGVTFDFKPTRAVMHSDGSVTLYF